MTRLTPEAQAAIDGTDPLENVNITEVMAEVGFKMAMDKGEEASRLRAALELILKLECVPFVFPADWSEQIEACSECQRYKGHPIQQGICDQHRKPLYARADHDEHQQRTLIYRAKDIARDALTNP